MPILPPKVTQLAVAILHSVRGVVVVVVVVVDGDDDVVVVVVVEVVVVAAVVVVVVLREAPTDWVVGGVAPSEVRAAAAARPDIPMDTDNTVVDTDTRVPLVRFVQQCREGN